MTTLCISLLSNPTRSGMFVVGPESAGAHPGPACYRKGNSFSVIHVLLLPASLALSLFLNLVNH